VGREAVGRSRAVERLALIFQNQGSSYTTLISLPPRTRSLARTASSAVDHFVKWMKTRWKLSPFSLVLGTMSMRSITPKPRDLNTYATRSLVIFWKTLGMHKLGTLAGRRVMSIEEAIVSLISELSNFYSKLNKPKVFQFFLQPPKKPGHPKNFF